MHLSVDLWICALSICSVRCTHLPTESDMQERLMLAVVTHAYIVHVKRSCTCRTPWVVFGSGGAVEQPACA